MNAALARVAALVAAPVFAPIAALRAAPVVALVVASALALAVASPVARAAGVLCVSPPSLTFGNAGVGTSVSQSAMATNCGDAAFTFTRVARHPATSEAFAISTGCSTGATLAPGATCTATITFAPATAGQVSGGLYLDGAQSSTLLTFYGRGVDARAGTAALSFVPDAVAFGPTFLGASAAPITVRLDNAGPSSLTPSAMVLNGPDARDFLGTQDVCRIGTPIAAGSSCTITLGFTPSASGLRVAQLVVDAPELADLAILPLSGVGASAGPAATTTLVEYHHAALDHYFMTPIAGEIALCDAGVAPCAGWQRTGRSFSAWTTADVAAAHLGVCRFYNDSFTAASTHFYALHGLGCEDTLAYFPDWKLESAALFAARAPAGDGSCGTGMLPVFRVYNQGKGGVPNHRFTTDPDVRQQMIAQGWLPEGYGIGVAFCVPA